MKISRFLHIVVIASLFAADFSFADRICVKAKLKKGRVSLSKEIVKGDAACPKKSTELLNLADVQFVGATGQQGIPGPQGIPGADGTLKVYGDGSAGPLIVGANLDWVVNPPAGNNIQFTDCSISPGATLKVPSGTSILCTGTFTNNGTIEVFPYNIGGTTTNFTDTNGLPSTLHTALSPPSSGFLAIGLPGWGQRVTSATACHGGNRGRTGFSPVTVLNLRYGPNAGSGGGTGPTNGGGRAGGVVRIIAMKSLTNSVGAIISANATAGGGGAGGGGGGLILLASPTSVLNQGSLQARGGNGSTAGTANGIGRGTGGGGGGGLIHFVSPSITVGNTDVSGGLKGTIASQITSDVRIGGAGGGAGAGGDGGDGGDIPEGNPVAAFDNADNGSPGVVLQSISDPTPLL